MFSSDFLFPRFLVFPLANPSKSFYRLLVMFSNCLGQPALASIQNSEWPYFRVSFVQ